MLIDNDEEMERMCHKCIDDATSNRCIRCGTVISNIDKFVNPKFDSARFDALSRDDSITVNKNFDTDKFNQLNGGD